jgi:hypothetical protein
MSSRIKMKNKATTLKGTIEFAIFAAFVAAISMATASAQAEKLLIITDQPGGQTAKQIQSLIQTTMPFRQLKKSEFTVSVKIIDAKAHPVSCHSYKRTYSEAEITYDIYMAKKSGHPLSDETIAQYREGITINRAVVCDTDSIMAIGRQALADRIIFVHLSMYEGGSGGIGGAPDQNTNDGSENSRNGPVKAIPIILSGSRIGIGLHEWIHTFGLMDEYALQPDEVDLFCKRKWVNVAIFNESRRFRDSAQVRAELGSQIPWLANLPENAILVTDGHLGSPLSEKVGIFPTKTCDAASPGLQSWKASRDTTIMESPYSTYVPKPYWPVILAQLRVSRSRIDFLMKSAVSLPTTVPKEFLTQRGGGSPRQPVF